MSVAAALSSSRSTCEPKNSWIGLSDWPALELRVAALEHDRQLPAGEHVVPTERGRVAARASRVALDERGAARAGASTAKRRFLRHAEPHRALGSGMEDQRPREVDQRIADRGHLPVDDGEQPRRRVGREQHVVELVVAVAERARLVGGAVRVEPRGDRRARREVAAAVGVELREPARDLPRQVVAGVGEVAEPARAASRRRGSRRARRRAPRARGRASRAPPPTRRGPTAGSGARRCAPSRRTARRTRASSAHATTGRAIATGSSLIASRMRNSRSTSCAVAELAWRGARRSTQRAGPRSTAKTSHDPPPVIGVTVIGSRVAERVVEEPLQSAGSSRAASVERGHRHARAGAQLGPLRLRRGPAARDVLGRPALDGRVALEQRAGEHRLVQLVGTVADRAEARSTGTTTPPAGRSSSRARRTPGSCGRARRARPSTRAP